MRYEDLKKRDIEFETKHSKVYKEEIKFFERTCELLISLFSNSQRVNQTSDFDYIQLISARILQDSRAALMLTLKGLYPQASSLIRSTIESTFLIYDFKLNPNHETTFASSGWNKRKDLFKAGKVRERVKSVTGFEQLKELYDMLSKWATHTTFESYVAYMETKGNRIFIHWAGREHKLYSTESINASLFSLFSVLMVLIEEKIYIANKDWVRNYLSWKEDFLPLAKKTASIFKIDSLNNVEFKAPKIISEVEKIDPPGSQDK